MQYKALILDVDGTLVAHGEPCARPQVAAAVKAAQKKGIKVVIATGRTYFAMSPAILGGIRPDFAVCANGAQVLDGQGKLLASEDFTSEEMYALVDFCEDYDHSLAFCFEDSYYVYVEYETMRDFYRQVTGHTALVRDGEDQVRHLQSMPFGAFAILPPAALAAFEARYGHLGLQFVPYRPGYYDVNRKGINKAVGVRLLMQRTGWKADELVSVGDNDNDVELMRLAGLSYCMADGSEKAKTAAKRLTPGVQENGVAAAVKEVFLQNEL